MVECSTRAFLLDVGDSSSCFLFLDGAAGVAAVQH